MSPLEHLKNLKKIASEIQNKNHLQVVEYFGLGHDTVTTVTHMIEEFLPALGDQPKDPKSEAYRLWMQIRARVSEACTSFLDVGQRQQAKQSLLKTEAEKTLRATQGCARSRPPGNLGPWSGHPGAACPESLRAQTP